MAEIGQEPYSTHNDGPSISWGKGTLHYVTLELVDGESRVHVTDLSIVHGTPYIGQ